MIDQVYALGPILLRNLFGWWKNSKEDGVIQDYEIQELLLTSAKFLLIGGLLYVGLDGTGVSLSFNESVTWVSLVDLVKSEVKSVLN